MEAQEPAQSFLYDTLLPKLTKLYLLVSLVGLILFWNHVKGGNTLCIVGLGGLAIVSFLGAFSPYNSLNMDEPYFEPVAKQAIPDRKPSFFLDIFSSKLTGIGGGVVLVGTLFKLMFWSGDSTVLLAGTMSLLVVVVALAFNQRMNQRAFLLAILGSTMLSVSSEALMRQLYRDDPRLVEAIVNQIYNPNDPAAKDAYAKRMQEYRHNH